MCLNAHCRLYFLSIIILSQASPPTDYNQYLLKRSGGNQEVNCDGQDELGCYNVRLYYDWFLIPGSCKCFPNIISFDN